MRNTTRFSIYLFFIFLIFVTCSEDDTPEPVPQKITYTVSSTITPSNGGTISPASGTYEKGETVTFTATPSKNFVFKNWSGGITGTENPITVTITSGKAITAIFEEQGPVYTNGEGEIGPLGGTVMVEDVNSPLNGVYLKIPNGALSEKKVIKISLPEENHKFEEDERVQLIRFEPEGLEFKKDVELGIPYGHLEPKDTLNLNIINIDDEFGEIIESEKIKIDIENKIISSSINHFSYWAVWDRFVLMNMEMLNVNGKIGIQPHIKGSIYHLNAYQELKWIPSSNLHILDGGLPNLYQCLVENLTYDVYSLFNVRLYEYDNKLDSDFIESKRYAIKRIKTQNNEFSALIYDIDNPDVKFETGILDNEDINSNNKSIGNWFSGKPLVFVFDEEPNPNKEYFVKIKWGFGSEETGIIGANHSKKYDFSFKDVKQKRGDMPNFDDNSVNIIIDDDYQLWDDDMDGVIDDVDYCPDTPIDAEVDENGCSENQFSDMDLDGVSDINDLCPDTPEGEEVDAKGCSSSTYPSARVLEPSDITDNSILLRGELVYFNESYPIKSLGWDIWEYPYGLKSHIYVGYTNEFKLGIFSKRFTGLKSNTKYVVEGRVTNAHYEGYYGSSYEFTTTNTGVLDSDGDGVYDSSDDCPNTPNGTNVDENGCPITNNNGLTNDINSLVPQYILDNMVSNGMVINEGNTPPNIENIYHVSPFVLIGSSVVSETYEIGEVFDDFDFKFSNQNNTNLSIELDYNQGGGATGTGFGTFLAGNNNKFTSFSQVNSKENDETAKTVIVISGTKTNLGIENCRVAVYMIDNYGNPSGYFIDNGTGRVFKDSDGFSEYISSLKQSIKSSPEKVEKSKGLLKK